MDAPRNFLLATLLLALLPCSVGCGAGVAGIVAGSGGNSGGTTTTVRAPTLALANASAPLISRVLQPRQVLVNNYLVPSGADVQLELRALGVVDIQQLFFLSVDPASNSSTITFVENHANIASQVSDPTAADVVATLTLLVDGVKVGSAVPFTLIQQRVASLELLPGSGPRTLSTVGGSLLKVRVTGRPNETSLEGVKLEVGVRGRGLLQATGVQVQRVPGSLDWEVTGTAPASVQPSQAFPRVIDDLAGSSTVVGNVFFRPEIQAVSPAFGSIAGGTVVALFGQGLAPLQDPENLASDPDFTRVQIEFERGGRSLVVPLSQLRQPQSSLSQLVFAVPQSPDGRPGPATVTVTVTLSQAVVSDEEPDLFVYRRPAPGFGPRGSLQTAAPVSVEVAPLTGSSDDAPDMLLLTSTGGVPRTEVLVAEQNGMFSTFGKPLVSAQQFSAGARDPEDVNTGDFDGDGDTDVLVVNGGGGGAATHTWLERRDAPNPLLTLSGVEVDDTTGGGETISVTGDFDGDAAADVFLVPTGNSILPPRLVLAAPASGQPTFAVRTLTGVLAQNAPYDAATVADLDQDGALDLVCLTGRDTMRVVTAYGDGSGSFPVQNTIDVTVPGYQPSVASEAVGVHAVEVGGQRPLALVFAGLDSSQQTPPSVVVLVPSSSSSRVYQQPTAAQVVQYPGNERIVATGFGELVGGGPSELVLAGASAGPGSGDPELRLLGWAVDRFSEVVGAFPEALEDLESIRALTVGLAVPVDGPRVPAAIHGVFVDHRRSTGGIEDRISTWLVAPGPVIVAPDASMQLPAAVTGAALGNFSGQLAMSRTASREARDLFVSTGTGLLLLSNDGVGDFAITTTGFPMLGIVPGTLTAVDTSSGSAGAVAFLIDDGRLGFYDPGEAQPVVTAEDLRSYTTGAAASWDVDPTSTLLSTDVNADGAVDLVVVLVLSDPGGSGARQTVVLLMPGKSAPAATELPFHVPDPAIQVEVVADAGTGAVVGDLVTGAETALELAIAFPVIHNEVRFYRYDPGGPSLTDDRYVWSVARPGRTGLVAGDEPAQLVAADLDLNGTVDLAVASGGDSKVRVFLNTGDVDPTAPSEVNIVAFLEGQTTPPLPAGTPVAMLDGDFDGDGVTDVLVATSESTLQGESSQHLGCYLSSGTGSMKLHRILNEVRTGNLVDRSGSMAVRDAAMFPALADINWDGAPDLVIGWSSAGPGDRNLRVMFAGAR